MSDYLEFLRERLGKNWVLARRSVGIICQYGEDVNCVGRKRYAEVER